MNPNLDTLVTSLYVTIDDLLVENRWWGRRKGPRWVSSPSCPTPS